MMSYFLACRPLFALLILAVLPFAVWARGGPGGAFAYAGLMLAQVINFFALAIGFAALRKSPKLATNTKKNNANWPLYLFAGLAIAAISTLLFWLSAFGLVLAFIFVLLIANGAVAYFSIQLAYKIHNFSSKNWGQFILHIFGSFWLVSVIFSLITIPSLDITGTFAFPWLVGFDVVQKFERFGAFLKVPLCWTFISACVVTLIASFLVAKQRQRFWLPFIFWISGVFSFFIAGNTHQDQLMQAELANHKPKHLTIRSFTTSFF